MSFLTGYKNQVELLLDILPFIQKEPSFALKGGTAINLFHRNMPRLSVDIDLVYLPIEPRETFLTNLTTTMQRLSEMIKQNGYDVEKKYLNKTSHIVKLLVSNHRSTVKIEPNTVLRGTVFEPDICELSEEPQRIFLQTQKVKAVSTSDLYAGKICAALDRQHPRDLFDVKLLFDNEGLTDEIRQAFVVYLASSPRPMSELLLPHELDVSEIYTKEFLGMTEVDISYDMLHETRKTLIKTINESLTDNERNFLLSIKLGEPDWDLLPISGLSNLPGLRWKVLNVKKMADRYRDAACRRLRGVLNI